MVSQHGDTISKTRRGFLTSVSLSAVTIGLAGCARPGFAADEPMPSHPVGDLPSGEEMLGKLLRVVRPGLFVTQEFNPNRITITVDDDDVIESVRIG